MISCAVWTCLSSSLLLTPPLLPFPAVCFHPSVSLAVNSIVSVIPIKPLMWQHFAALGAICRRISRAGERFSLARSRGVNVLSVGGGGETTTWEGRPSGQTGTFSSIAEEPLTLLPVNHSCFLSCVVAFQYRWVRPSTLLLKSPARAAKVGLRKILRNNCLSIWKDVLNLHPYKLPNALS